MNKIAWKQFNSWKEVTGKSAGAKLKEKEKQYEKEQQNFNLEKTCWECLSSINKMKEKIKSEK